VVEEENFEEKVKKLEELEEEELMNYGVESKTLKTR
jgi:hypothetical protein